MDFFGGLRFVFFIRIQTLELTGFRRERYFFHLPVCHCNCSNGPWTLGAIRGKKIEKERERERERKRMRGRKKGTNLLFIRINCL